MTPQERSRRVRELFDLMMDAPADRRDELLRAACGGDESLRAEVMGLLAMQTGEVGGGEGARAHRVDLSRPAFVLADVMSTTGMGGADGRVAGSLPPGTRIGPYELKGLLGVGGFGMVYEAERREPFVQRVALKVIKPGMDSGAVISRFEQERQTLAVMDHPNVARVIDGGVTSAELGSRPYFVMELVRGQPITVYCDRHRLTIRQRLELFMPVCEAVQHAHMKGIIHRDLKPSNILVGEAEGEESRGESGEEADLGDRAARGLVGRVRVIDFGVAKAISKGDLEKATFTQQGLMIGTPEYMSPEQAAGAVDIDTRTDVYSLGVVLYELLTGALPFEPESLRSAGLEEIRRIIREEEPPTPSGRLSLFRQAQAERVAEARGVDAGAAASLARELKRELEWVPLKAMRKERERRYGSAAELGEDVGRYLRGEALGAGPESRGYRVRKFVGRHRGAVGAGAAVMASLVMGLGTSIAFAQRERNARIESDRQREVSMKLLGFLNDDVLLAARPEGQGPETRAAELLEQASAGLPKKLGEDPVVEAAIHGVLGRAFLALGLPERARPELEAALRLSQSHQALLLTDEETLRLAREECDWRQMAGDEAVVRIEEVVAARKSRYGPDDCRTLDAMDGLAAALKANNKLDEAESLYRELLDRRGRNAACGPVDAAIIRKNLALVVLRRGDATDPKFHEEINRLYEEALAKLRGVEAELIALVGERDSRVFGTQVDIGGTLRRLGRWQEVVDYLGPRLPRMREVLGFANFRVLEGTVHWARGCKEVKDYPNAVAGMIYAYVHYRETRGVSHPDTVTVTKILSDCQRLAGSPAEGLRLQTQCYEELSNDPAVDPARRGKLAANLAEYCRKIGDAAAAARWDEAAKR